MPQFSKPCFLTPSRAVAVFSSECFQSFLGFKIKLKLIALTVDTYMFQFLTSLSNIGTTHEKFILGPFTILFHRINRQGDNRDYLLSKNMYTIPHLAIFSHLFSLFLVFLNLSSVFLIIMIFSLFLELFRIISINYKNKTIIHYKKNCICRHICTSVMQLKCILRIKENLVYVKCCV